MRTTSWEKLEGINPCSEFLDNFLAVFGGGEVDMNRENFDLFVSEVGIANAVAGYFHWYVRERMDENNISRPALLQLYVSYYEAPVYSELETNLLNEYIDLFWTTISTDDSLIS